MDSHHFQVLGSQALCQNDSCIKLLVIAGIHSPNDTLLMAPVLNYLGAGVA